MAGVRKAVLLALVGLVSLASLDPASARHARWHRYSRHIPHHFVFDTPQQARIVSGAGEVGGTFGTGILGPSTANPYEHPGYGYNDRGRYGPGFFYPSF